MNTPEFGINAVGYGNNSISYVGRDFSKKDIEIYLEKQGKTIGDKLRGSENKQDNDKAMHAYEKALAGLTDIQRRYVEGTDLTGSELEEINQNNSGILRNIYDENLLNAVNAKSDLTALNIANNAIIFPTEDVSIGTTNTNVSDGIIDKAARRFMDKQAIDENGTY